MPAVAQLHLDIQEVFGTLQMLAARKDVHLSISVQMEWFATYNSILFVIPISTGRLYTINTLH